MSESAREHEQSPAKVEQSGGNPAQGGMAGSMLGNVAGQIGQGALHKKIERRRLEKAMQRLGTEGELVSDGGESGSHGGAGAHGAAPAAHAGGKHGAVQASGKPSLAAEAIPGAAAHGVEGAAAPMPHLDAIQKSFGADHDVSHARAQVGGPAAEACATIGAQAYASGDKVAFASSPDLHTAAHEAAHVVQQQRGVQLLGGVGEPGDAYEQNADAVADRVVAGQPAGDLLGPAHGAGGQQKAVQGRFQLDGGGAHKSAHAPAGKKSHYTVELKAWIPHAHVVDPEEQLHGQKWLDDISTVINTIGDLAPPGASVRLKYKYNSKYRGDGHPGYAGGHRVITWIDFDWDGHAMSNVHHTQNYGTTHRDYDYHAWAEFVVGAFGFYHTVASQDISKGSGVEAKTATKATSATGSGSQFHMSIASANPVVMTWAPDINSDLDGSVHSDGGLDLHYNTDEFPSHGLHVYKNGALVKEKIVEDVSGVTADGIVGAINVGTRLTSQDNKGTVKVP